MTSQSKIPGDFIIADTRIAPGERAFVALPVSHTVTGLSANLLLEVIHGARPGPTIFVSAAIHGDEIGGTAIIQELVKALSPQQLAGTVILAPAVNIYGFIAHSRYLPDRRDLNRSFPGNASGSLASQLAHCFFENVISRADLGIDLHTAAIHRYNLPQIRIAEGNARLLELAEAFAAPVTIESPLRDGSMRALAQDRNVPMLLLEAGEALRFDRLSIEVGAAGVLRVLIHLGMLEASDAVASDYKPARAHRTRWIRSPRGGVAHAIRSSGDVVQEGELIASVSGLFGEAGEEITSPVDGIIIGHATLPVVNQGDALFHIAEIDRLEATGREVDALTEAIAASEPRLPGETMLDEDEVD